MRLKIVSLLPSATEICYALGLGDAVVGVTHECDYPAEARGKPVVSTSVFDATRMGSAAIDEAVRERLARGESIYTIDRALLARLKPDLILTQNLCDVCAVSPGLVQEAIRDLDPKPEVMSLDPAGLDDILDNALAVGRRAGRGGEAETVVDSLRRRVGRVALRAAEAPRHGSGRAATIPKVFCMEWMDPVFNGGHWIPELIRIAGGEPVLSPCGEPGRAAPREKSNVVTWEALVQAAPEVLVVCPCGYDVARTVREIGTVTRRLEWAKLPAVRSGRVWAANGSAYFSRPGPRMVDGLEVLAHIVQPEVFPSLPRAEQAQRLGG